MERNTEKYQQLSCSLYDNLDDIISVNGVEMKSVCYYDLSLKKYSLW